MNKEIKNFVQDTLFDNDEQGKMVVAIREVVLEIKPEAKEEIKYGGLVFIVDEKLICGIFTRKEHISVEFSFGVKMIDDDKLLEGSGKHRRHLKIYGIEDLAKKKVKYYIKQAFKL